MLHLLLLLACQCVALCHCIQALHRRSNGVEPMLGAQRKQLHSKLHKRESTLHVSLWVRV